MQRLMLTGIGGSIGCHTMAHIFHHTDWHIIGIDSFRHKGLTDRVVDVLKSHPEWSERLTLITHDLSAPLSDMTYMRIGQVDYIINMAALSDVEASIDNPTVTVTNNVQVALNMLELARWLAPKVFIQISTDEVYGPVEKNQSHPEWSPIVPSNPYSASKACQEAIAIAYWRTYNVPVVITNTMNNFGEMQQGSKFPAMLQKKIAAGETVQIHGTPNEIGSRFYLHSRNHADALLFILQHLSPRLHEAGAVDKPDRYNIVGDVRLNNLQLAGTIAKLMNKELKYRLEDFHSTRPGHDLHYGLDGTKLKALGWTAPLDFEDSLKKTIEWQMQHPEWL